ncbi:Oligosaccharide translocation protein rft1, partial [Gamsiella multidivaricata]
MEHPHSSPTLRQRTHATSTTTASSSESSTTTPTTDEASSILSSSVQGASYLVLLQFVSRMLTFTLNQVLLRFTSAETLGIASVQLELLLNTILFLSREGVRCAAIRVSDDSSTTTTTTASSSLSSDADRIGDGSHGISDIKDETAPVSSLSSSSSSSSSITSTPRPGSEAYRLQKLVNMVYAPIPIGALMTVLAVGYCLSHVDSSAEARFPHYRLSIYLYGLSALIELLAEPMFMVAQYKLWFKTRVSVEGTAVIVRCVLTCALTIYGNRAEVVEAMPGHHHALHLDPKTTAAVVAAGKGDRNTMGVLAFAVAQFVPEYFYFDPELLKLSKTLTAQSLLKHILTEGDKMLMAGLTNEEAQG